MEKVYITLFRKYEKSEATIHALKREASGEKKILLLYENANEEIRMSAESFIPGVPVTPIPIVCGRKRVQLLLDLLENMPEGAIAYYDLTFADPETFAILLLASDCAKRIKNVEVGGIFCGDHNLTYIHELREMVAEKSGEAAILESLRNGC